jgi:hypothetical protein
MNTKKRCKETTYLNILFLGYVTLFFSCRYSDKELNHRTESLKNRFLSNQALFIELRKDVLVYAEKTKRTSDRISLRDVISDSSDRLKFQRLNIAEVVPFLANENRLGMNIYFNDIYDPNLFISFKPNFDVKKGVGRNPLRAVICQDTSTKDAWIIQQYYEQ